MEIPFEEYEKIKDLYTQHNAENFKTEQVTFGIEWTIPALEENMWNNNGIEYHTLEMAKYIKSTMNSEHMKVRIVKYTKSIKRDILND
jgi:hypothetical protein